MPNYRLRRVPHFSSAPHMATVDQNEHPWMPFTVSKTHQGHCRSPQRWQNLVWRCNNTVWQDRCLQNNCPLLFFIRLDRAMNIIRLYRLPWPLLSEICKLKEYSCNTKSATKCPCIVCLRQYSYMLYVIAYATVHLSKYILLINNCIATVLVWRMTLILVPHGISRRTWWLQSDYDLIARWDPGLECLSRPLALALFSLFTKTPKRRRNSQANRRAVCVRADHRPPVASCHKSQASPRKRGCIKQRRFNGSAFLGKTARDFVTLAAQSYCHPCSPPFLTSASEDELK